MRFIYLLPLAQVCVAIGEGWWADPTYGCERLYRPNLQNSQSDPPQIVRGAEVDAVPIITLALQPMIPTQQDVIALFIRCMTRDDMVCLHSRESHITDNMPDMFLNSSDRTTGTAGVKTKRLVAMRKQLQK